MNSNPNATRNEHQTRIARISNFIELVNQKNDPEASRTAQWVLHRMNGIALFGVNPFEYEAAEVAWDFTIDSLGGRRDRSVLARAKQQHPIDAALDIAYDLHTTAPLNAFMRRERDVPEAFLVDLFINITRVRGSIAPL
jgi:hypothetical protein